MILYIKSPPRTGKGTCRHYLGGYRHEMAHGSRTACIGQPPNKSAVRIGQQYPYTEVYHYGRRNSHKSVLKIR